MTVARRDFDDDRLMTPTKVASSSWAPTAAASNSTACWPATCSSNPLVQSSTIGSDTQIVVDDGLGGGDAWFQAEGPITLADQSENQLRIVGRATFVTLSDEAIDVGASPATNDLADSGGNVRMGTLSFQCRIRASADCRRRRPGSQ